MKEPTEIDTDFRNKYWAAIISTLLGGLALIAAVFKARVRK